MQNFAKKNSNTKLHSRISVELIIHLSIKVQINIIGISPTERYLGIHRATISLIKLTRCSIVSDIRVYQTLSAQVSRSVTFFACEQTTTLAKFINPMQVAAAVAQNLNRVQ